MGIKFYPLVFIFLCLFVISCSLNKSLRNDQLSNLSSAKDDYYPGVDSTVVKNANEIADRIFVDYDRRNQAIVWHNTAKISFQIADSIWSCYKQKACHDSILLNLYLRWQHDQDDDSNHNDKSALGRIIRPDELSFRILCRAEKDANQAKLINPFDLDIRSLLINIYSRMGEINRNLNFYTKAIEELKNLLLVDKSNPYVYERLAECYYALQDWENCYLCFDKAEQVLLIVAKFKNNENKQYSASIDTARWVYYLQGKGEAKAKLYDSDLAITYLTRAKQMTHSTSNALQLQNYLNWIKWDDGNLKASELRDEAQRIEQAGDFKKAHSKYLELLEILTTQKAKNEIDWKVASIDFNHLSEKLEAIQRMFRFIQDIQKSGNINELNNVYLQDYAAMCYSIGVAYYNQNKYRLAYIYINQAAQFEWDHRGDCYLQLAILSEVNPRENIQYCQKAFTYPKQLSDESQKKIQKMLTVSFIRLGEFDLAQNYYQKFLNSESSPNN
jgi:tetratricopeptide (TPR) repeat protein